MGFFSENGKKSYSYNVFDKICLNVCYIQKKLLAVQIYDVSLQDKR